MKSNSYKQVNMKLSLISWVKKHQKYLQSLENIKFGKKAKTISFPQAQDPKKLSEFILNGGNNK